METTYLVCAILGGTLITCQFLLSLLGLGGDHDVGHDAGGHDFGGHDVGHDAGHDGHHDGHEHGSNWFLGWLTFRTLTAGTAFFGLVGLAATHAEVEPGPAFVLALAAGL